MLRRNSLRRSERRPTGNLSGDAVRLVVADCRRYLTVFEWQLLFRCADRGASTRPVAPSVADTLRRMGRRGCSRKSERPRHRTTSPAASGAVLARKQLSGSGGRSTHDSALPAPRDRDQPQQAETEQPHGGRDRHGDVSARLCPEREDDVGDNGAGGGAGERERPCRRCVDERVVRIIISDRPFAFVYGPGPLINVAGPVAGPASASK